MKKISILDALNAISKNELVIAPTETFYGIISRVISPKAISRIFCIKRRDPTKPLPVVIGDISQLDLIAYVDDFSKKLIDVFWPGSISILFPAKDSLPIGAKDRSNRIAVRFTPHPIIRHLCVMLDEPLTASSANFSNYPPPASLDAIDAELSSITAGVITDLPYPSGGRPSTLIEPLLDGSLRILRHGAVSCDDIARKGFKIMS